MRDLPRSGIELVSPALAGGFFTTESRGKPLSLSFSDLLPYQPGAFLVAQVVKKLPATQEMVFDPWVGKSPWRREWQPTPVFLPGEFHGQRSLVGYSPGGRKESDMTEQLSAAQQSVYTYWLNWGAQLRTYECQLIWEKGLCRCN